MFSKLALLLVLSVTARAAPVPQLNAACSATNDAWKLICIDETHFAICNWGTAVAQAVSAGMVCTNNALVPVGAAGSPAPASSSAPATTSAAGPTSVPEPVPTDSPAPAAPIEDTTSTQTQTVVSTVKSTSQVLVTVTRPTNFLTTTIPMNIPAPITETTETTSEPTSTPTPFKTSTPAPAAPAAPTTPAGGSAVTEEQILAIAPSSSTCAGASFADECATAAEAAPFISNAFSSFGINTPGEKAALLSLMAFESAEFKFNINHFPGTPGQGTRNMMMFPFILEYVQSLPSLASQIPSDTTSTAAMNQVRALVLDGTHTFATAAWFYSEKCTTTIKSGVQAGTEAGWEAYITECVGTTVTPERQAYFTKALTAFS